VQALALRSEMPGVLFVDDEVNILKSLTRLFKAEPIATFVARSAREAIDIALKTSAP